MRQCGDAEEQLLVPAHLQGCLGGGEGRLVGLGIDGSLCSTRARSAVQAACIPGSAALAGAGASGQKQDATPAGAKCSCQCCTCKAEAPGSWPAPKASLASYTGAPCTPAPCSYTPSPHLQRAGGGIQLCLLHIALLRQLSVHLSVHSSVQGAGGDVAGQGGGEVGCLLIVSQGGGEVGRLDILGQGSLSAQTGGPGRSRLEDEGLSARCIWVPSSAPMQLCTATMAF